MTDTQYNTDYHFTAPSLPMQLSQARPDLIKLLMDTNKSNNIVVSANEKAGEKAFVDLIKGELANFSNLPNEVIKRNLEKVQQEIQQKSSHIAQQFDKKFILVGGLFGLLVLFFKESFVGHLSHNNIHKIDEDLLKLCHTSLLRSLLAISVIICIGLDIRERADIAIANMHGAWIARYIELPILSYIESPILKSGINHLRDDVFECDKPDSDKGDPEGKRAKETICKDLDDPNKDGPRIGWESSLRITHDDSSQRKEVYGMHHDPVGHLLFGVQFHYLTMVLYVIYVALLYLRFIKVPERDYRQNLWIDMALFSIVQGALLAFAVITREASDIVKIMVVPFTGWVSGGRAMIWASILGLFPTGVLLVYYALFRKSPDDERIGVPDQSRYGY